MDFLSLVTDPVIETKTTVNSDGKVIKQVKENECELTKTLFSVSFVVQKAQSVGIGPNWSSSPKWTTKYYQCVGTTG